MMKRKFLAVVLPIIGCATVVGSGFSAWYFGQDVANGDKGSTNIGINVTEEVKASTANLKINLDATTIDGVEKDDGAEEDDGTEKEKDGRLVLDQGGARNKSVDSGIMFGKDTSTVTTATGKPDNNKVWAFTVSYDGTVGGDSLTIDELYDAGLRIRIEMKVTIGTTLYKYIDYQKTLPVFGVDASVGDLGTNPTTATFEKRDKNVITADYIVNADALVGDELEQLSLDFVLDLNTKEKEIKNEEDSKVERIDYSNSLFVYKENKVVEGVYQGGKPENSDQLDQMQREAGADSVTFAVIAHIEDDPTK